MTVTLERGGPVAQLRLGRPEALNAFDASMVGRMREQIAEVRADRAIRAVVLAGNGPSFCTGVDVKALASGQLGLDWFRELLVR
jgi:isohexenylglutaconyl-CoA hydratase